MIFHCTCGEPCEANSMLDLPHGWTIQYGQGSNSWPICAACDDERRTAAIVGEAEEDVYDIWQEMIDAVLESPPQ